MAMAKAKRDLPEQRSRYDRDFFAWTREQAALLRREAARGLASDLDFENLAEDITCDELLCWCFPAGSR
jgi:hypothetical protein